MSELATLDKILYAAPGGRSLPGCVANPPDHVPPGVYRGWDHRNCEHPTPPPAGYRRCEGDPGCEARLLVRGNRRMCGYHDDLHYGVTPAIRYEELMGAQRRTHGTAEPVW